MSIETALFDRLSNFAGLSALVSTRIYPLASPQNPTPPYVVYQRISGVRVQDLNGPVGTAQARFQFDAWATTFLGARAVADQIRYALDGYRGTNDSVLIRGAIVVADRDDVDDTNPSQLMYRASLDFIVSHDESTS